jgi:GDP-mannose 6-dehydrogenase
MTTSETSPASEKVRLSIFGLGYVGCVSAACLAARGHTVLGVDANPQKTDFIRDGRTPIVEEQIGELIADVVSAGRLKVSDPTSAVHDSDITIVCVGTPSGSGGSLSTEYLERASEEIGTALRTKDAFHVVVYRSTMVPGTCEGLLIPILEKASGKKAGTDFGVCLNPEFLRESTSVKDFLDPPKTVVGESDERSGELVMSLYDGLPGPRFRVPIAVAEMTKYVDNSFHALKVTFGNEVGAVAAALGLDSHKVIDIFLSDTKLNISPTYLRPGFAFGGSCLPKDVRALTHTARQHDIDIPMLSNLLASNEAQIRRAVEMITSHGRRKIGIFGLSFKSGTDDLRESPLVELAERLTGKGYELQIFDSNVAHSRLIGANKAFLDERLPHISQVLTDDADAVLAHAEICVVATKDPQVLAAIANARPDQVIIDLVRLPDAAERRGTEQYTGIAW